MSITSNFPILKLATYAVTGVMMLLGLISCQSDVAKKPLALGRPDDQCEFPSSKAVAKLYIDNGSLSISTTDYTVTYQDETISETIIFYSVSSPWVETLRCKDDSLELKGLPGDESFNLELGWIKKELIETPLIFYKSKLESVKYASQVKNWGRVFVSTITPSSP